MDKVRASLCCIGASAVVALLLIAGCAKPASTATQCRSNETMCDGECVDTASDHAHCGSCTNACTSAQVCNSGQCSSTCSGTTTSCSGSCVDTKTSANNCNGCGIACGAGRVCNNGTCGCAPGQTLCSNGSCAVNCNSGGQGGTPGGGQGGTPGGGQGGSPGGGFGGSTTGQGGSPVGGQGGAPGGQGGFTGAVPAGWWTASAWHGCAWTGIDNVTVAPHKTTITPTDFTAGQAASGTYHVSGSVGQDPLYNGVALLGFNLNQSPAGASCVYNPAAATQAGPPGVTFPAGPTGIAVNFSKTSSTGVVRIQIQAADGATNPLHRWCYGLTQVQGKDFAPFSRFYTQCYNDDGTGTAKPATSLGAVYDKTIPISAIVFLVPGTNNADLPYDITVNGFALGTTAADAPDGGTAGTLTGMIGGADPAGSTNADFQRVKVTGGTPLHSYVIQNNNWGQPANTQQTITYANNSFTILSSTGNPGSGVPASFPSIYVGASGNTMGGAFSTIADDGLPKAIGSIGTASTTFTWSGGATNGNFNATYDVWFAANAPNLTQYPTSGYPEYQDGQSGFLMVWFYKPANNQPIGSIRRTASVGGKMFNVWSGPRATGPSPNAPVVSYVAQTPFNTWTFDLKAFITDATTNRAMDANGGILPAWYLTDVFAGFEIWSGSDATNLKVNTFTIDVK